MGGELDQLVHAKVEKWALKGENLVGYLAAC